MCYLQDLEKLYVSSPATIETPPVRQTPFALSRASSSASLSPDLSPEALPFSSISNKKGNPPLDDAGKKALSADLEKAKDKLKQDKAAAKDAVKSLKNSFSKPGKTQDTKDTKGPGRGGGKGRGRGRGRKAVEKPEKDETEEIEDLDGESLCPEDLQGELDGIQDVDEDMIDEDAESHGSLSADTEIMGSYGPEKKPRAKAKAKAKARGVKKGLTKREEKMAEKMKENKAKRAVEHKRKVAEIKAKAKAATSKTRSKSASDSAGSTSKDANASQSGRADKAFAGNLRDEMHKFVKAESTRLKEGGMAPKEALAAAREAYLCLHPRFSGGPGLFVQLHIFWPRTLFYFTSTLCQFQSCFL